MIIIIVFHISLVHVELIELNNILIRLSMNKHAVNLPRSPSMMHKFC